MVLALKEEGGGDGIFIADTLRRVADRFSRTLSKKFRGGVSGLCSDLV